MKKIMVLAVVCAALFSACNKATQIIEEIIAVSSLPAAVAQSVASNYPDAVVYTASKLTNGETDYILTLNTQEEVAFKESGECQGDAARFHGDADGRRGHGGQGGGGFDLRGLMGGHHDGDNDRGHHGAGHGVGGCHGHEISLDSLPGAVKTYITTNYANYTVRHAEIDTLCSGGGAINVAVAQAGVAPVRLFFDTVSGAYLMKGERTDFATLPQVVRDYITTNYTAFTQRKRAVTLTLANGEVQYMIFMHQAQLHKNVLIKADGNFICER